MYLAPLQQAILTGLQNDLPQNINLVLHSGELHITDVLETDLRQPHLYLSFMRTEVVEKIESNIHEIPLRFKIFIVSPENESLFGLLDRLLTHIPDNRWHIPHVMGAQNVHAQYISHTQSMILWSINWQQKIRVDAHTTVESTQPNAVYICDQAEYFGQAPAYTPLHRQPS